MIIEIKVIAHNLKSIHKIFAIAFACLAVHANAQTLSASELQYLGSLRTELVLSDGQYALIDTAYTKTSSEIAALDKEIQSISRSDLAEEQRTQKIADLNQKKKTLRETRDLTIQLYLTPDQKKIYDEKIKPAKPAVIHMGINHDRSNCTICVPK